MQSCDEGSVRLVVKNTFFSMEVQEDIPICGYLSEPANFRPGGNSTRETSCGSSDSDDVETSSEELKGVGHESLDSNEDTSIADEEDESGGSDDVLEEEGFDVSPIAENAFTDDTAAEFPKLEHSQKSSSLGVTRTQYLAQSPKCSPKGQRRRSPTKGHKRTLQRRIQSRQNHSETVIPQLHSEQEDNNGNTPSMSAWHRWRRSKMSLHAVSSCFIGLIVICCCTTSITVFEGSTGEKSSSQECKCSDSTSWIDEDGDSCRVLSTYVQNGIVSRRDACLLAEGALEHCSETCRSCGCADQSLQKKDMDLLLRPTLSSLLNLYAVAMNSRSNSAKYNLDEGLLYKCVVAAASQGYSIAKKQLARWDAFAQAFFGPSDEDLETCPHNAPKSGRPFPEKERIETCAPIDDAD